MSPLSNFSFAQILPFALFGAIAALAWLMLEWLAKGKPRLEERLDEFRDPHLRKERQQRYEKANNRFTQILEKATPTLSRPLQPKSDAEMSKLRKGLAHAGFRGDTAVSLFLSLKLICLGFGAVAAGGTFALLNGLDRGTLIRTIAVAGVCFYLPNGVVWWLAKRRKLNIFLGLPDAIDLMVVCVEAGLGLDQAMRKVAEEMAKAYPILAREFGLCNFQLQLGRSRSEVLHDLGERTGVEDLQQLASILVQADKFGSSVGQALRVQSDSMRTRRRQIAEEKAAKTAVQLIFPLVLFIFPGIFVVLVGPAAITMVNKMFPLMGGS